jgi:hypothetical protein
MSNVFDEDIQHMNIHDTVFLIFLTNYIKWDEIMGAMVLDKPQYVVFATIKSGSL